MKNPPPMPKAERTPLLYRISSVMALLEISHATVYRMVANGELELIKLSTRASRITSASVARVLEDRANNR
jgi:predicted DNA-binding transcriptional regulator AlpA